MKKRYENRAGKYSLTDYRKYRLCLRESVIYGLLFLLAASAAGVLLFNRVEIGIGTGVLLQPVFRRKLRQFLQLRRKIKLEEEFCRYMQLTAASLAGGTALDNVFREIADTAAHGDSRYMEREFRGIDRLIRLNYDCPEAFQKFASRTGSRDIESIAAALRTVAESGGGPDGTFKKWSQFTADETGYRKGNQEIPFFAPHES